MILRSFLLLTAISLGGLYAAEDSVTVTGSASQAATPAGDTVVLTLPGGPAPTAPASAPDSPAPAPSATPKPPEAQPAPAPPKPELPEAFKNNASAYLQHGIGVWKKTDAEALLGPPLRSRLVYDENKKVNGQIFAWHDPTGRYRELELDFEAISGNLRTVFFYPNQMTWDDCRKLWGANVNTTHAKNGRTFYSYLNRNLDVLVDSGGKVISLGLY